MKNWCSLTLFLIRCAPLRLYLLFLSFFFVLFWLVVVVIVVVVVFFSSAYCFLSITYRYIINHLMKYIKCR